MAFPLLTIVVRGDAERRRASAPTDPPDERVIGQLTAISASSDWELQAPVSRATSHHHRV